jgi:hypothetical protein
MHACHELVRITCEWISPSTGTLSPQELVRAQNDVGSALVGLKTDVDAFWDAFSEDVSKAKNVQYANGVSLVPTGPFGALWPRTVDIQFEDDFRHNFENDTFQFYATVDGRPVDCVICDTAFSTRSPLFLNLADARQREGGVPAAVASLKAEIHSIARSLIEQRAERDGRLVIRPEDVERFYQR